MSDILMVADPSQYADSPGLLKALWLTADDFWQQEELVKKHDEVLWQSFNTHGKYARLVKQAHSFAIAVNEENQYVSSAFVVVIGDKWLIEYVMTDPAQRAKGAGSSVMSEIMRQAKVAQARWVILNCDPQKNNGQLPAFYAKFGFHKVA